ncbi:hypothetical protein OBBRIDRAFT_595863 [Obba rivulosa]|uniref:Uncharacterized protein n=1 Tax=Obba rivulosa TaxID=1052685 RepID=A0A8E2AWI9_9APHY|nr:hypothetical protein OBBRIDRAFT_595863 [Obba rivulosa]
MHRRAEARGMASAEYCIGLPPPTARPPFETENAGRRVHASPPSARPKQPGAAARLANAVPTAACPPSPSYSVSTRTRDSLIVSGLIVLLRALSCPCSSIPCTCAAARLIPARACLLCLCELLYYLYLSVLHHTRPLS